MKERPKNEDIVIDLDSYDWGEHKLTKREKLFIIYYTLPFQKGFSDATQAALKAGYTNKSAYSAKFILLKKDYIKELIDKFMNESVNSTLENAYRQFIGEKVKRATYNVKDYYKAEVYTDDDTGNTKTVTSLIPIDELTDEQASIINNVAINNTGIATYDLPNKDKMMDDVIKLYKDINSKTDTSDFEVGATVDIVKENLASIKISINNRNSAKNQPDFIENDEKQPDFD